MATPKRRSSRLRSGTPQNLGGTPVSFFGLSSLVEREETPNTGIQSNLDTIASSPSLAFKPLQKSASNVSLIPSPLRTPTTISRPQPSPQEMHPGRFHASLKKRQSGTPGAAQQDLAKSAHRDREQSIEGTPTKLAAAMSENTPPKTPQIGRMAFSSPTFEFKMTRPSTELSTEAQKMMDEVREQAAKIKAELVSHRAMQSQKDSQTDQLFGVGGRKIATPKGKVGRFSDVHMEQFKKMDSIANHASSFRADNTRFSPNKSLKRSNSKAGLDSAEPKPKRSISKKTIWDEEPDSPPSPAKRFKQQYGYASKPVVTVATVTPPRPLANAQSAMQLPDLPNNSPNSTVTTPTKASLARSASVKSLGKNRSMIPSLNRTMSSKTLSTPSAAAPVLTVQTEGNSKRRMVNKLASVRSILKCPQLRFSDDPVKIAAGTHVSTPKAITNPFASTNLNKDLPDLPATASPTPSPLRKEKHVNFSISPDDNGGENAPAVSPGSNKINYPALPGIGSPQHLNTVPSNSTAARGDFTFRAGQSIKFSTQYVTNSPAAPTIRQVPQNTATAPLSPSPVVPTSYPQLPSLPTTSTEPKTSLPSVPHGLPNKKRKRSFSPAESPGEDKENILAAPDIDVAGSPAKKARTTPATSLAATKKAAVAAKGKAPTSKNREKGKQAAAAAKPGAGARSGFLSLSRLNALAMPKTRK